MKSPINRWVKFAHKLGFAGLRNGKKSAPARARTLSFESLEARELLAADIGEIGSVTLGQPDADTWQTVHLANDYINPVIVAGPLSSNGSDPATIRIRNVDAASDTFEVQIDEWLYLDDWHTEETFSFMAIETGRHQLSDGTLIEAGNIEMNLDRDAGQEWFSQSFATEFENAPVVFSQITTRNGSDPAVTRQRNVDANGFELKLREEEKRDNWHVAETVGFVAFEAKSGESDGRSFESGFSGNRMTHQYKSINFDGLSLNSTIGLLAAIQTNDGGDTANVRYKGLSSNSVSVNIDEEQSKDREVKHTTENVGYLAWELGPADRAFLKGVAVDHSIEAQVLLAQNTNPLIETSSSATETDVIHSMRQLETVEIQIDLYNPSPETVYGIQFDADPGLLIYLDASAQELLTIGSPIAVDGSSSTINLTVFADSLGVEGEYEITVSLWGSTDPFLIDWEKFGDIDDKVNVGWDRFGYTLGDLAIERGTPLAADWLSGKIEERLPIDSGFSVFRDKINQNIAELDPSDPADHDAILYHQDLLDNIDDWQANTSQSVQDITLNGVEGTFPGVRGTLEVVVPKILDDWADVDGYRDVHAMFQQSSAPGSPESNLDLFDFNVGFRSEAGGELLDMLRDGDDIQSFADYFSRPENVISSVDVTYNMPYSTDRTMPLQFGISNFVDSENFRHNTYFGRISILSQDWDVLESDFFFRYENTPENPATGELDWGITTGAELKH